MEFRILRTLTAAFCLLAVGGAEHPASAKDLLKIGLLLPLGGDRLERSVRIQNGVLLAAKLIQERIGESTGTLRIVSRDSHDTVPDSVAAARKLVTSDGVAAIIGPISSDESVEAVGEVAAPGKVLFISPSASSPDLTHLKDDDFFFRTIPSDGLQAKVLADLRREQGGLKTGVLYLNNLYGRGLTKAYRRAVEAMGQEVVATPFIGGQSSYRTETEKALAGEPETLLVIAAPDDGVKILTRLAERDQPARLLLTDVMKDDRLLSVRNAGLLTALMGTVPAARENRLTDKFREVVAQTYADSGDGFVLEASFDAAILLALAALRTRAQGKEAEGATLRDSLRFVANPPGEKVNFDSLSRAAALLQAGEDVDYEGVSGPVDFDPQGDVVGGDYVVWGVRNGAIVTLSHRTVGE